MRAFSLATIASSRAFAASASLRGLALLDLQPLRDLRLLFLLLQGQAALGGVELRLAHRDLGFGFDLRALLLVGGDDLGELPHPDGIECVVLVERCERRLIQARERYRIEQHAVLRQILAQLLGDVPHELAALLVQVHPWSAPAATACSASMKRPSSRLRMPSGLSARAPIACAAVATPSTRGLHTHIELEIDIDSDAIGRDQRVGAGAPHLHAVGAHVDLFDLVQERQRQAAAGQHHLLPAEARCAPMRRRAWTCGKSGS